MSCRIGEKLIKWPDHRYPLSLDNILTLVTFYWHTNSFSRNLYPYRPMAEAAVENKLFNVPTSKAKPFGYSVFPSENILMPEAWAKKAYPNLVYYKRNEKVRSPLSLLSCCLSVAKCLCREGISLHWNNLKYS